MKIETKICLFFMAPLFIGVFILFLNLFCKQSESLRHNYREDCRKLTNSLADSYQETFTGRELHLIHDTISKLRYQKNIISATISELPNQKILAFTAKDEYSEISKIISLVSRLKGERFLYKGYIDESISGATLQLSVPMSVSNKKSVTLTILFDESHILQQVAALKRNLYFKGLLVFFIGAVLIFTAGIITAKYYTKRLNGILAAKPVDVFDLPALTRNTNITIKQDADINYYQFTPVEAKIIKLIPSKKNIRNLLQESPVNEILTFELISRFVVRGILEIK